jgi:DhnA family fructose-bisphosphate aldolase class Ia
MARMFRKGTGRLVLAPVDDSLLAGPVDGLETVSARLVQYGSGNDDGSSADWSPDAIIGFRLASNHLAIKRPLLPFILNLTASTTLGVHVEKSRVARLADAIAMDASAVAVHVNFTSRFESQQLSVLAELSNRAAASGLPVLGILYPRREREGRDDNYTTLRADSPDAWARMVCHATRVGVELGCSIIKTQWTGSTSTFERVVRAGEGAKVVIAGGTPRGPADFVELISAALAAGAAGVSFGRNFFSRADSRPWLRAAAALVHSGENPREVLRCLSFSLAGK